MLIAINNKKDKKTICKHEFDDIDNVEIGIDVIIKDTKYKIKTDLKELILRYFDWYEMIEAIDDNQLYEKKDVTILASGE